LEQGAGQNSNVTTKGPPFNSREISCDAAASSAFAFDIKETLENVKETIVSIRRSDSAEKFDNGD
jgi:hypothetical protein